MSVSGTLEDKLEVGMAICFESSKQIAVEVECKIAEAILPRHYQQGFHTTATCGAIGAAAGKPVMEGKAALFKRFAGIDAFPICLDTQDPDLIVEGCRRAIDIGVYPFVVPLRPTVGSLMEDLVAPSPEYCETIYRRVVPYLRARGIGAHTAAAGCARCQACSGMSLLEERTDTDGRTFLPLVSHR